MVDFLDEKGSISTLSDLEISAFLAPTCGMVSSYWKRQIFREVKGAK